ncbi:retrovirus-related pol polyprotein from transposon TNT 1-94 [Tanacetum coccineum]
MSCLPYDIMESVISCEIAKATWTDLVYSFESPLDTKENKIMDLKLEYQTFRVKPTESLSQTYTRYKTLLNEIVNDGVNLFKHEINIGFVNNLPEKLLTFSQGLRNANHTQNLDLADIYERFDFQENSDNEVDERSSKEYLRDLDIESHKRALLANSKLTGYLSLSKGFQPKFTPKLIHSSQNLISQADPKIQKDYKAEYKKMKAKLALLKANPSTSQTPKTFQPKNKGLVAETFDWDEEEVLDDDEVTQVKVLIPLADDELTVGKNHVRNDEWIDITMKKVNILLSMDEDADWKNYLKYINIDLKFVKEQRLNLLSKDWVKRLNPDNKLPNFNTERFLVPESQAINESLKPTDTSIPPESSKDSKAESPIPLPPMKNLQGASPSSENRTFVEAARTMLSAAKVPLFFWAEAIATACFTPNRSLVIPRHEKTPYHIINGYSTQSRAYRVYNKRTKVIVETIHVNSDELPQMASNHVSSDPVPQYLVFSPMFDELINGTTQVVPKSSDVTTADAPNQKHTTPSTSTTVAADTPPLNIQTTPETTSQSPTQAPTVTANENIIQAETNKEYAQVDEDEFINIFSTPLETDGDMCMFALTVSRTEPKNIKEAMADSAWIEAMQEELHQFDGLDVWELVETLLAQSVQCYNCSGKRHYARNCPKPRVRDSKYFMEQMLLAKPDEAGVILTDEHNDFLFADISRMEEIEELSANICLMARIQQADKTFDAGPSYDYAFISEVQSSSNIENEEQIYPTHTKIINSTIGDDQIDSDIIFDSPNGNVNSDSIEKDTHVSDLCALEQLAKNAYQKAEKQQIFAQKVQKQNTTLTSQLELYKERVRVLGNINGDNNYLNEFLEADKRAKHFSQQAQS